VERRSRPSEGAKEGGREDRDDEWPEKRTPGEFEDPGGEAVRVERKCRDGAEVEDESAPREAIGNR